MAGKLDNPVTLQEISQAFADGMTRQEMADQFEVSKITITAWRKDPRVKKIVAKLVEERILRVSSKIDSVIDARLKDASKMDTQTLLKIRKEYLGGAFRAMAEGAKPDDDTLNEAMDALDNNPELAEKLMAALKSNESKQA